MTYDEIEWKQADREAQKHHPVGHAWKWCMFVDPQGVRFCVNTWAMGEFCHRKPFAIDHMGSDGYIKEAPGCPPLWEGNCPLELMCAIEHFQLTPEVTSENMGEGDHRGGLQP